MSIFAMSQRGIAYGWRNRPDEAPGALATVTSCEEFIKWVVCLPNSQTDPRDRVTLGHACLKIKIDPPLLTKSPREAFLHPRS